MESASAMLGELWGVWAEMLVVLWEFAQKAIIFSLWILCGIIVLPCVFIAGNLYPKWVEWAEKM